MTDSYGIRTYQKCKYCEKRVHARGLCTTHSRRLQRGTTRVDAPVLSWGRTLEQRLLDGIEYDPNGGCWLWSRTVHHFGYGRIGTDNKSATRLTHNVAWELWRGPIPNGLQVLHRCDVPQCVNPDHLFLGTQKDNIADMMAKGRHDFSGLAKRWQHHV